MSDRSILPPLCRYGVFAMFLNLTFHISSGIRYFFRYHTNTRFQGNIICIRHEKSTWTTLTTLIIGNLLWIYIVTSTLEHPVPTNPNLRIESSKAERRWTPMPYISSMGRHGSLCEPRFQPWNVPVPIWPQGWGATPTKWK